MLHILEWLDGDFTCLPKQVDIALLGTLVVGVEGRSVNSVERKYKTVIGGKAAVVVHQPRENDRRLGS